MTNLPNKDDNVFCTLELTKRQARAIVIILSIFTLTVLAIWVAISENHIHTQQAKESEQIKIELEECRAEATAWYNAATSLSDEIALTALRGQLAEQVNTEIALAFAVKGHELKCIQPKLPTG